MQDELKQPLRVLSQLRPSALAPFWAHDEDRSSPLGSAANANANAGSAGGWNSLPSQSPRSRENEALFSPPIQVNNKR